MRRTFKLAVTGAVLGMFVAVGLPAFAGSPPQRRSPTVMGEAPPVARHFAGAVSQARQAVPRAESAPPPQAAPPPAGERAVPRYPATPATTSAVERRSPGRRDEAGTAVRRVDDEDEGHDGGAAIIGLGLGGFYGDPFWADGSWGPGWGGGGWGPYAYSSDGYYNAAREQGGIHIKVKPKTASVFVDGYYVGVVNDFDGFFQKLNLQPGPHRIEIRQQGYKPITFDVKIEPGQTITYKGSLAKLP